MFQMPIRSLPPLVRKIDARTTPLPPKQRDPVYATPEFRIWRKRVVERAGGRCEAVVDGHRCSKAEPEHRMYADHRVEIRDGGAVLDLNNGQCVCASHHQLKTAAARARRMHD